MTQNSTINSAFDIISPSCMVFEKNHNKASYIKEKDNLTIVFDVSKAIYENKLKTRHLSVLATATVDWDDTTIAEISLPYIIENEVLESAIKHSLLLCVYQYNDRVKKSEQIQLPEDLNEISEIWNFVIETNRI